MIRVYIACPYTNGDVAVNVKNSMDVAEELIESGFLPFNPLYSHFQHMAHPRPYDDWMKMDIEWLKSCDCVLRVPGESKGADVEVEKAIIYGIPVFYSINDLVNNKFDE